MALSFFTHSGTASQAKYFDIRLDDDYIVFRGSEDEAASTILKGKVVLCLSEPLTIKYLRLHLCGMSRVLLQPAAGNRKAARERNFFEKTWSFKDAGKGKTETLPADNYEFPFDIILPGSLPESVEGLRDSWVTYRFKAEIGRKYAKDVVARKPLRIIRTLDPSALELAYAMSIENVWPNKIEYSISTPSKAVIFGTSVQVDFRLVPLLKGLKIGTISTQLLELHDFVVNPDASEIYQVSHKSSKIIVDDPYTLEQQDMPETPDGVVEGFEFSRVLNLPKSLSKCLQDTNTRGIRVKHKLKFRVQLQNPDGHTSELRATLPISIFISPNLAIDDNNNLVDQTPQSAQRVIHTMAQQAPPVYGEHQFDQLYSEVDPAGYRTPGNTSEPGTPYSSLSRNLSMENLSPAGSGHRDISPTALHTRLSNLHLNGSAPRTPPLEPAEPVTESSGQRPQLSSPGSYSPSIVIQNPEIDTPGTSRRPSEDDNIPSGMATPNPHFSQVEDLSRVPSYTTALKSRVIPQYSEDLPDYQAATAGDISLTPLRLPQRVHVLGSTRPSTFTETSHRARLGLPDRSHSSIFSHGPDTERRLRILQARARA
ncbi:hypothetical protein AJ79_05106 [Helicocarpus griseus UAMH5409]|uniref:Carbon catabolite repressor D n=1 Tax=Helicocarpus griseus UAMH5409 TaxID=1447875 RepID=A0A2B7XH56_9EURO|nr:hypothetical protein AJ79_05106 [Helicocarpus griseus UAMH5409]